MELTKRKKRNLLVVSALRTPSPFPLSHAFDALSSLHSFNSRKNNSILSLESKLTPFSFLDFIAPPFQLRNERYEVHLPQMQLSIL